MIMKKMVVLLIIGLMTAMSAAAQSDKWVPDSISEDSIIINQSGKDDIERVEWDKRYGVAEKDGKWALYDFKGDSLLTGFVYDEAGPAYRKRVFRDYITYYYIKENGRIGIAGVYEDTNSVGTIFTSQPASLPEDEEKKK